VAINPNGSASVTFNLQSLSASTVTPYVTSSQGGLMQQSAVGITNNSFNFTMPGQSIVTFVTAGSGGGSCTTAPGAPGGLAATAASSSSINVSWSAVTPPANCSMSSYNVYRSTTNGFTPSSSNQVGSTSGTTFTDTGLTASTTYYYKVEAVDAAGSSAASAQASATTPSGGGCTAAPSAPSGLTATAASSSSINLSWGAVTPPSNCSISSYTVYRSTTNGFTPSSSNQVGSTSGTTFTDTGLTASTTYYYKVEAVDAAGSSAASAQASATTQSGSSGINTSAWYEVINKTSGLCMDDPNGSTSNGAALQQYSCHQGQNQEWQFRSAATGGYYAVYNRQATSLVWDDTGGSTSNGNKIQLYTYSNGNRNQEWQAISLGNGLWQFKNLTSGLCLDDTGGSTSNGTQMQQYSCSSSNTNQQFTLSQQ